jgi:D-beta-D-heptose 7-phosphate kinase/D-beta-D-heptose 1-phosphate adenosyltransferase
VNVASRIVVVGDALLDRDLEGSVDRLCPDAPVPVVDLRSERARPGGAALAAVLAAADGGTVTLVTALGDDPAGGELRTLVELHGVELVDLGLDAPTPEKLRVLAAGRSLIRLDRGERRPAAVGTTCDAALTAIASADAVLVADYGRGVADVADLRGALERAAAGAPLVWDPHPNGPAPIAGATLVTPNTAEAARFAPEVADGAGPTAAIGCGRALRERWSAHAVAVTLGAGGALLVAADGQPRLAPAAPAQGGDPCGAGDRFASRAVAALASGATIAAAVDSAVAAATGFVDAGGAAGWTGRSAAPAGESHAPPRSLRDGALELAEREHAAGRRLIATGGCFDLLHAGHVQMLQAARALGDALIVCLNSDASVAALKGDSRPLVAQTARAAVLEALESVDAVIVFDEPTPEQAIARLRPDVWVKGGDYAEEDLPEAPTVRAYGGEVVVLPHFRGHSTTRLIEAAVRRDAA